MTLSRQLGHVTHSFSELASALELEFESGRGDLDLALAAIGGVAALHEAEHFDQTEMTTKVEDGSWDENHLFFYALTNTLPTLKRCGEVDAAPYMRKELFLPRNKMALRAYVRRR